MLQNEFPSEILYSIEAFSWRSYGYPHHNKRKTYRDALL